MGWIGVGIGFLLGVGCGALGLLLAQRRDAGERLSDGWLRRLRGRGGL